MVNAVGVPPGGSVRGKPLDSARGKPVESRVMTSRPLVSHATTILDQISMRAASANAWTGIQMLSVVFVALLTAAAAQLSFPLPFTPVPFTIQPMIVLVGAAALGARLGAASQILYLTLGIAGLPVFAYAPDLPQGFARLLGPSGGYLMAYPLAAFMTGLLAERGFDRRFLTSIVAMGAGLSIIFLGGVAWIARFSGFDAALATGLYPFIVVDVIKIVAAGLVLPTAWKLLK
jgi:biotin transport system substrate-specific component